MKPLSHATLCASTLALTIPAAIGAATSPDGSDNPKIDFSGFLRVAGEVEAYRAERRVTEAQFLKMAAEPGTIILDTRSAAAYQQVHVEGAVHINFSNITKGSLAKAIPSKQTRVLIYCNNNFESDSPALASKAIRAALNIPTFITLYEYGYRNIYELGPVVDPTKTRLRLVPSRCESESPRVFQ